MSLHEIERWIKANPDKEVVLAWSGEKWRVRVQSIRHGYTHANGESRVGIGEAFCSTGVL